MFNILKYLIETVISLKYCPDSRWSKCWEYDIDERGDTLDRTGRQCYCKLPKDIKKKIFLINVSNIITTFSYTWTEWKFILNISSWGSELHTTSSFKLCSTNKRDHLFQMFVSPKTSPASIRCRKLGVGFVIKTLHCYGVFEITSVCHLCDVQLWTQQPDMALSCWSLL